MGVTIVNAGIDVNDTNLHTLNGRTLTINAPSTWSDVGEIRLWNAAVINNNSTFVIQNDKRMYHYVGALSTFNNNANGTTQKSSGSGDTNIDGHFFNRGILTVGTGTMTFGRTFDQTGTGTLFVGIDEVADFDVFVVSQAVTLAGTLDIDRAGSFTPESGTFQVITGSSVSGTFSMINDADIGNGNGNGYQFVPDYTSGTDVTLEVQATPP